MRFVIHPQHGVKTVSIIVWDAEANTELCTFVDGEFETEDKAVIEKLVALGYEGEEAEDAPIDVVNLDKALNDIEDDEQALRAQAKALGIKSWHVKSVETLKEEIEKAGA